MEDNETALSVTPPIAEVIPEDDDEEATTQGSKRTLSLQDEDLISASLQKQEKKKGEDGEQLEGIFEPRPSTSNSPASRSTAKRSMSLAVDSTSERRQRLALLPRTSQYEKHPLLQERSGDAGLSELEIFLHEKEQGVSDVQQPKATSTSVLVPRAAHYETSALLAKKSSGLTELEQYLQEKEAEMLDGQRRHSDPNQRHQRLEPRSSQYQESSLLQSKGDDGLSPIEHLLISKLEQDAEDDKGKCSARCACKNAHCANCKSDSSNSNSSVASSPKDSASHHEPKHAASIKHVRFDGNGQKDNAACAEQAQSPAQPTQKCKEGGDAKFWKLGSGRKKGKESSKELDDSSASCKVNAEFKKKSNASSLHKRSCAIS